MRLYGLFFYMFFLIFVAGLTLNLLFSQWSDALSYLPWTISLGGLWWYFIMRAKREEKLNPKLTKGRKGR